MPKRAKPFDLPVEGHIEGPVPQCMPGRDHCELIARGRVDLICVQANLRAAICARLCCAAQKQQRRDKNRKFRKAAAHTKS
jgi:hypothetical protein